KAAWKTVQQSPGSFSGCSCLSGGNHDGISADRRQSLRRGRKKMSDSSQIVVGAGPDGQPVGQPMRLANRHGLVAGATGTGKTVTLQHLAEIFSDAGVAVFAADVKGDLCGLGAAGTPQGKVAERIAGMPWLAHRPQAYPVTLWDIAGESGHPLRTTLSEMGP